MPAPEAASNSLRPIFLIGPGRSGSTLLHYALAMHPDLAWISSWTGRLVRFPQLAFVARLNEIGALERHTRSLKYWPRPSEAYLAWNRCIPGFSSIDKDLGPEDVSPNQAQAVVNLVATHMRWQRKPRFITKYTGWPRIALIRSIFPKATLIHLERHPCAVVYSYYKKGWRWGDLTPESFSRMTRDELLVYYANRYLRYYDAKQTYSRSSYAQVFYEDMIEDFTRFVGGILDMLGLATTESYQKFLGSFPILNDTNADYQKLGRGADLLHELLERPLRDMSYS